MHVLEYLEIVLTAVIGSIIIIALFLCYAHVFRHICCPPRPKKNNQRQKTRRESISLKYIMHISNQQTETSVV
ncbi:hypothetical protein TcasGA2_TC032119 [Tribolium castaneum]|uniref:Uncharacterized protein n=1 Tax=Tribolium castaneum TaxID=7070 RepID=A0A139WMY3_TRICA|nr:hypothetical protein TcasGA2_TC032119 [Tribolium castaneum]